MKNSVVRESRREKSLDALRRKDWDMLRAELLALHPSDVAELIIDLSNGEEGIVFRLLPRDRSARVFAYLPFEHQETLLHSLSTEELKELVGQIPPDDRTRLLEELPPEVTRRLLESLSPDELANARQLLGYAENTAGRFMTPKYVAIQPGMTAAEALASIRSTGKGKETLNVIYIVDGTGKLIEDVRLGSLVLADPGTRVTEIVDPALVAIVATDSVDDVLQAFEKYDRVALPVVDRDQKMLGIITVDDVLDLAERKSTREMQKVGGTEALDAAYLDTGFWSLLRKRGGWLSALFLGEMLTATAMGYFEVEIQRAVVLALFVPLIISSGGNSGSQATSLMIRSLALQELRLRDWTLVFRREVLTGLLLGSFLGFIGFLRIILWQHLHFTDYGAHYLLVGATVWASLVGVVMFGSLSGSMLPFILRRLGFDPATSSAPFVATLVDVTGLVIYFSIALLILRGTLL
jgi:magnesium transporter